MDIRPSNGVWDFRWDGQGRRVNTLQELIEEAQTSAQKDESGVFRDSVLCGVPSIYTNFRLTKESCAQLWFTSSSVQNQSAGCVGSHQNLLEKDLKSLGFEKQLFFNLIPIRILPMRASDLRLGVLTYLNTLRAPRLVFLLIV